MMRTRSKFGQNHISKTFTFNMDETIRSIYFHKRREKNGQNIHQMFRLMQHTIPKVPGGGGGVGGGGLQG